MRITTGKTRLTIDTFYLGGKHYWSLTILRVRV